jgi:hypothetical protein
MTFHIAGLLGMFVADALINLDYHSVILTVIRLVGVCVVAIMKTGEFTWHALRLRVMASQSLILPAPH